MLAPRQMLICTLIAVFFWAIATASVHVSPDALAGWQGDVGFVVSIPICMACIALVRRCAALTAAQLPSATLIVLGIAMLCDATALRWAPTLYATDEHICRLAGAWLLWGYGVSAMWALWCARRTVPLATSP
ncbi:hypothetical protein AA103196_2125 [Ameyamaea chiangmaiensis NBRC 103196]|uniref:Uncharacterized protein n=1 Tax=Ameyamaea chiangmaiensis TaxID=442969 RepID=A0A850PBZ9_9PROT|nr:hypothetical protein [Ameyamaea chiangmaiensis]MBS4073609.1 hypothetical protein [Ameyamaea chiangmaiensis]NVN40050.1 hypothetical protein [Ameyamaea chiangmaiensis]GBQ69087.1 hypothetical protein AA103196_2125 [Ameyamaea chiangmaiensis NBRC 103196]